MQLTKMPGVLVLIAVAYAMTGEGVSWGVDASTRPARVAAEAEVLATQLSGPEPTRQVEAVGKVRKLLETEPNKAVGELRGRWLKAMMAGGRYDDAVAAERDLPAATGNTAKAMKAEDGTIGRANGWILSLRPGE